MPARKSQPAQDHTGESLFGLSTATEMPDGGADRQYDNQGDGLVHETSKNYNERYGRQSDAPTLGGPREKADVLIAKGKAYGRSK
jgi:hypothetical protein